MTRISINEVPNSSCTEILDYCHCIEEIRQHSLTIVNTLMRQNPLNATIDLPLVAIAMAQRADEIAASATILLLKNRERDAGVLILSAYELQLDAMYIAQNPIRANIWLDHARENCKPWKIRDLQTELFPNENEFDAEVEIYRRYSMIKHCNPTGGIFAFPVAVSRNQIHLDVLDGPRFAYVHLFALGTAVVRTLNAVSSFVQTHGFDLDRIIEDLKIGQRKLNALNRDYILRCIAQEDIRTGK